MIASVGGFEGVLDLVAAWACSWQLCMPWLGRVGFPPKTPTPTRARDGEIFGLQTVR